MVKDGTWDCGGALIFYIVIVIWASRCEPVFNLLLEFLYIWSHCIHIFFYLLSWHHLIGWSSEVSWSLFLPYDLLILEPPYSWRSIVYFGDTAAVLRCSIMVPFLKKKKTQKFITQYSIQKEQVKRAHQQTVISWFSEESCAHCSTKDRARSV
jgi:hypothetical protein